MMNDPSDQPQVVVAGHICLDIIPTFRAQADGLDRLLAPGKLVEVGPAAMSSGGVSNTGIALHRLGIRTKLIGRIGDDLLGRAILEVVSRYGGTLAEGLVIRPGESSSYTLVITAPGMDRMFLHYPGPNDAFGFEDVNTDQLAGVRVFHFGYPPVMRRMYSHGGNHLASLMKGVKARGLTASLDMAYPDPDSEAGHVDWTALLARVLPHVDIFLPSLDEILFMLDRREYDTLAKGTTGELAAGASGSLLSALASRLLGMGVAIVVLKLGNQGLYARTAPEEGRLAAMGAAAPKDLDKWLCREILVPCFKADLVGTTGAGDCTIAGFLAGLLKGLSLEEVMTDAVAVGAFNVEHPDATSGVPKWEAVEDRVRRGWKRLPLDLSLDGWLWDTRRAVWIGPNDRSGGQ